MRSFKQFLGIHFALLFLSCTTLYANVCQETFSGSPLLRYETVTDESLGYAIDVRRISADQLTSRSTATTAKSGQDKATAKKSSAVEDSKLFTLTYKISKRPSIYVGIFAEGHVYLTVYDGNKSTAFHSAVLQNSKIIRSAALRKGLVFRIDDPTLEMGRKILADFEQNPKFLTTTCAQGVCTVLSRAIDFRINERQLHTIIPGQLVKSLLNTQRISQDSKTSSMSCGQNKVEIETYLLGVENLKELNQTRTKVETKYALSIAAGLIVAIEAVRFAASICGF